MKTLLSATAMAACLALNPTATRADVDWKACENVKDQAARIRACTVFIEDASSTFDDRAKALLNRADAYGVTRDPDHAIADYSEILSADPSDYAATFRRGVAFLNKGDNDRAIADFDEALRITPQSGDAFLNRGFAD